MSECLPDLPRYIRQRGDEWQGADHQNGPWRPIPAPQTGLPWPSPPTESTAAHQNPDGSWQYQRLHMPAPQGAAPWADGPAPATITPADRLALAVCSVKDPGTGMCVTGYICNRCRRDSAAVAHETAAILRERHAGSSQVADWLDGVGCHTPEGVQTVQEETHA
jgi:hypothetical protein